MNLAHKALLTSKKFQKFSFDSQTYTIRRNLMFFSSLAIASSFINPHVDTGKYEVNIGLIKGSIDSPIVLYSFILMASLYYAIWFFFHCQSLVVRNYDDIKCSYVRSLCEITARYNLEEFRNKHATSLQSGLIHFTSINGNVENWTVSALISEEQIRKIPDLLDKLMVNTSFVVTRKSEGASIEHTHKLNSDDLIYLKSHIDCYWRIRKEEMFVTLLPLLYTLFSTFLIVHHIVGLYQTSIEAATS